MRATFAEGDGGGHGRSGAGLVPRAAAPRAAASRGAAHRRRVGRAPADRRGGQLHHHAAQAPPRLPERGHGPGEVRRLAAGGLAAHRAQADPGARILVRRNVGVSQSCMVFLRVTVGTAKQAAALPSHALSDHEVRAHGAVSGAAACLPGAISRESARVECKNVCEYQSCMVIFAAWRGGAQLPQLARPIGDDPARWLPPWQPPSEEEPAAGAGADVGRQSGAMGAFPCNRSCAPLKCR